MMNLEQDILCVLLQRLQDKNLITQDVHDKAKCKILDTLDWPEFFCYAGGTAEGAPFAAYANLSPQLIASEEPKYLEYSDSSEPRFETKSCAQSIKKAHSAVPENDKKEEEDGHTQNSG